MEVMHDDQGRKHGPMRRMCHMTTLSQQVQSRTVDGVRIRYADSGGSKEPTEYASIILDSVAANGS
jgi:hypothetical protein